MSDSAQTGKEDLMQTRTMFQIIGLLLFALLLTVFWGGIASTQAAVVLASPTPVVSLTPKPTITPNRTSTQAVTLTPPPLNE